MKTKLLMLSFTLLFIAAKSYTQVTTTTNIAIQGIARDELNNAVTNKNITLKFTIHYTNASGNDVPFTPITANLVTDAFGVFSYLLDVTNLETTNFFDNQLKLKIEQTSPVTALISDENFNHVPYAVSASNGVPTGSIMPYIGTTPPKGWALCDGNALPPTAVALKAMIGDYTPDLRGMFLRGAGTNSNGAYAANAGPALKNIQTDIFKSHLHDQGTLVTNETGEHKHTKSTNYEASTDGDGAAAWNATDDGNANATVETDLAGKHTHTITGNTGYSGGGETRPINYGVNYIIKL